MYIAPLDGLIRSHGVRYHQYADDSQVYIAISRDDADAQLATLEHCVSEVYEWLLHNGLALEHSRYSVNQARSKPDPVKLPVRTARTFVHH